MMNSILRAITAAALLSTTAAAALAANDEAPTSATGQAGETIKPDQMRATKIIGSSVYDINNEKLGSVQDIVLDNGGSVAAVVVNVGGTMGMGGKDVAVRPHEIRTENNRLTLNHTKQQLLKMASYKLEDTTTGAGTTASPVEGGPAGGATPGTGTSQQ